MSPTIENQMNTLKKLFNEFKQFAIQGNAIELAIGVIIGSSFSKIVSSLVSDILMPPIGLLLGGINIKDFAITLRHAVFDQKGALIQKPVVLNIGNFIQSTVDFVIVALVLFMVIKAINTFNKSRVFEKKLSPEAALLKEIRDILVKNGVK